MNIKLDVVTIIAISAFFGGFLGACAALWMMFFNAI